MVKISRLVDYRIRASNPASTVITLTANVATPIDYKILSGQQFSDSTGQTFITLEDFTWPSGKQVFELTAFQQTLQENQSLGVTNSNANQTFNLPPAYVHDTATVRVGAEVWTRVNSLGRALATDKVFVVEISTAKIPFIKFGDGLNGAIPADSLPVLATYYITNGSDGNVAADTITSQSPQIAITGVSQITATNLVAASGGSPVENLNQLRNSIPLSIRTLDRAVTREDYRDLAELSPGVAHAAVSHTCGKNVDLYIAPMGGGIAQQPLLDSVTDNLDKKKTLTTQLAVYPAGVSDVLVEATVTAKFRKNKAITLTQVQDALIAEYNYDKSYINRPIRVSDVIALIDNLSYVDYLKLDKLALIPYARPIGHTKPLLWNKTVRNPLTKDEWTIQIENSGIRVLRNGIFIEHVAYGNQYYDPFGDINFTVYSSGNYVQGDEWKFTTYPKNEDIEVDDNTVPVMDYGDLNITVIEQV